MSIFGPLAELRARPIPDQTLARARRDEGYRKHAIDRAHPLFAEPLVPIQSAGVAGENYYYSEKNPPYWGRADGSIPDLALRKSVVGKLARVNMRLARAGLALHVFDAWRPLAVQTYFHDVWMPAEVKRKNPSLSGAALTREVERYWGTPTADENSPAPHATGAAVDLSIRWKDGDLLWMGSIFDDVTELAHRDLFEREPKNHSDAEARANRRLLHWLMVEEGFFAHPDEWWHFSWGDQYWAKMTGQAAAHYGAAAFT